jgi:hypothetical protein
MTVGKEKKGRLGASNLLLDINSLEVTHSTSSSIGSGLCRVREDDVSHYTISEGDSELRFVV